ncbi:glycosyltransferase family 87 protein [Streptomyces sp. H10-C2]|uniref:glycosyltransferase family 87 protein n=1 Tax=unclassified Streptomyces TaxID=2593676 RepID=UPI0024BA2772|nr:MULTISPECIES: glycosyltransferase family 87 protein [unclassified Streptomyces]MDJ0343543.1 glycosyltransferase family 87 protein [Streptomyces sp. PH10-H1]MDJ0368881.1 glycosyltransferase family 87 protein [Streptomyces sp. H10-C2]
MGTASRAVAQWWPLAVYWAASRMVMLAVLRTGQGDIAQEVHRLYARWSGQLAAGSFPAGDVTWQYPPGAGLVMLGPRLLPMMSYLQGFVALMLLADAVMTLALARAARAGTAGARGSAAGAWMWTGGLPLLLALSFARFDVAVAAMAAVSLLVIGRRPWLGGALAGIAAMIKVWPALIVLGTPRGRSTRQAWSALLVSAAVLLAVLAIAFQGTFGFLSAQGNRGVEVESMGGTVLHLARLGGWPGRVRLHYGSFEFIGPYVSSVAHGSLLLTAVAFGWLLLWRWRARVWSEATVYDAALTAVLLFTATSRVISPQYLIWLIALAAVCLTVRGTTQRPVAALLLLTTAVTSVDFPLFFGAVLNSSWQGVAVLVVRNGLLAVATLLSCVRLWRAAVPPRRTSRLAGRLLGLRPAALGTGTARGR